LSWCINSHIWVTT